MELGGLPFLKMMKVFRNAEHSSSTLWRLKMICGLYPLWSSWQFVKESTMRFLRLKDLLKMNILPDFTRPIPSSLIGIQHGTMRFPRNMTMLVGPIHDPSIQIPYLISYTLAFYRQSLQIQRLHAELFHKATALRGINGPDDVQKMPLVQRQLALRAIQIARQGLEITVTSPAYREGMRFGISYQLHFTICHSIASLFSRSLYARHCHICGLFFATISSTVVC